jgi:hypothetical protein
VSVQFAPKSARSATPNSTKTLLSQDSNLAEFAVAVADGLAAAKEFIMRRIVPAQGLDRFLKIILESTESDKRPGIDLRHEICTHNHRVWSQIAMAFQVRHLLEHTNGEIDGEFLKKVGGDKKQSSWADHPFDKGLRIEMRDKDFDEIFDAMVNAAPIITDKLKRFVPATVKM